MTTIAAPTGEASPCGESALTTVHTRAHGGGTMRVKGITQLQLKKLSFVAVAAAPSNNVIVETST